MFGFVMTNAEELSPEEKDRYQQIYCGLCHALGRKRGQATRLSLNHDLAFLATLLMSLYEPDEVKRETRCALHPTKKHLWSQNDCIDYAADMTVALTYHKCADDWSDDRSVPARAYALAIRRRYEEVRAKWPRQCRALEEGMRNIAEVERDDCGNPDAAANLFGQIMGEVFVMVPDMWENPLRMMGAQLGRFVYMMDAAVDLDEDRRKGSYNPFAARDWTDEEVRELLTVYMGNVTEVFEKLPLVEDINLLRNILYSGVWVKYNAYLRKKRGGDEGSGCVAGLARGLGGGSGQPEEESADGPAASLADAKAPAACKGRRASAFSRECPRDEVLLVNGTLEYTAKQTTDDESPARSAGACGATA